jgi:pimeloyl-ACP methyl ester carboxylesterase/uncharacterized membrane protein HdeD (DUF308 family)
MEAVLGTDIADLRLHVRIDEGVGPVIVVLHGINADADYMRPLIDQLGSGHRIIAPDLLGFGKSPKPLDIEYSLDEHAQVLEATLQDAGVVEPYLLVGYSLGGSIAARYAATYPQRLRRLFLLSAPFYLPPEYYSQRGFGLEYAQAMLFTWLWKVIGRQKEENSPLYQLASGPLRGATEEFVHTDDLSHHWDVMALNLENAISKSTFIDDLPKLTMPTVFALGVNDAIVRPDQTLALKRLKPELEIRRIRGLTADHMVVAGAPERVAAEILRDEVTDLAVSARAGSGTPVVLLGDLEEPAASWRPVVDALSGDHDVVALDLLGFGRSPSPLSGYFTLADHTSAVLGTARKLFGDQPFVVAGRGFGGTVALSCAATDPALVGRAVAFSPMLPDLAAPDDPHAARQRASHDALLAAARDERVQRFASDRLERQVLPTVRSVNSLLATSTAELLGRIATPAQVVFAGVSHETQAAAAAAAGSPVRVDILRGVSEPGRDVAIVAAAVRGLPLPEVESQPLFPRPRPLDPLSRQLGGINARLIIRGVVLLLAGLALLVLRLPLSLVTVVLAGWLAIEAGRTLYDTYQLYRRRHPWVLGFIVGVLEVAFAAALVWGALVALHLVWLTIIIGGLARAAAILVVAWKAPRTPGRRWKLVVDGLFSLVIAIAMWSYPPLGTDLLQVAVAIYLLGLGVSAFGLAMANQLTARRRVRQYLAALPTSVPAAVG